MENHIYMHIYKHDYELRLDEVKTVWVSIIPMLHSVPGPQERQFSH